MRRAANGTWYVHWSDGRRSKRASLGTQDEIQARTRFAQWILVDGKAKSLTPGSAVTIEDIWKVYDEKHVKVKVVGQRTVDGSWVNLKPHFGSADARAINQGMVDLYIDARAKGAIGKPSKPITIRRELAYLIAALNFAAKPKIGILDKGDIPALELPPAGAPRDRWLRIEEVQRLLDAAGAMRRGDRLSRCERFLWIALETAARKQAILDLTWDRVDFEAGVIHFADPSRPATKKKRASVPISDALRPVLERALKEKTGDLVLDNKSAVWASVQRAAIRAGFSNQTVPAGGKPKATGISPHVLRHTAATHMARNGVPLWVIAKILGNTLAMVEKVYAKWQPDSAETTVNQISGAKLRAVA